MNEQGKINKLTEMLQSIYREKSRELLFHGWHHIIFVKNKSIVFAKYIGANQFLVESAALVHDLNYIVEKNSEPEKAREYRENILFECGYTGDETKIIENIIMESHTATRNNNISNEGKALSDADTLFKVIPTTPILFTGSYIKENKVDLKTLAKKITSEQNRLFDTGIYFYTDLAKEKYLGWAKTNLNLWNSISESLEDDCISEMLELAKNMEVI